MGTFSGPEITNSGLVLHLDSANEKSLNIPSQADHGFADWYCTVSGTATYSIVSSTGGIIYENNAGTITTLVTATTPQRGTITITAGRTYYGSVPINLVPEDAQHSIVPLTMAGTQFWNIAVRNNPATYYVYSPYSAATVNFYDNTTGGLTGTPTSTLSLSAGQSGTFTSNNLTNHWISSTVPIVATVAQAGADRTILSPMASYVYQRYSSYYGTTNFTTPTVVGTNVIYDNTYKVMSSTIADGSGGDCAQGLGLEYLSDTYSFGNVVSDYGIAAPYDNTVITTYYWSGSAWIPWDSHTMNGTITSPAYVRRDGTAGPGVDGPTITGGAANMASGATLWKWEGNKPFYLCINDSADDEFSVLGWTQSRTTTRPRSGVTWNDRSGSGITGTLTNGPVYSSLQSGYLTFNGTNSFVDCGNSAVLNIGNTITVNVWVYIGSNASYQPIVAKVVTDYSLGWELANSSGTLRATLRPGNINLISGALTVGNWYMVTMTFDGTTLSLYLNGVLQNTATGAAVTLNSTQALYIGARIQGNYFNGNISNVQVYGRALTAAEIQQNFYAMRGRFGI